MFLCCGDCVCCELDYCVVWCEDGGFVLRGLCFFMDEVYMWRGECLVWGVRCGVELVLFCEVVLGVKVLGFFFVVVVCYVSVILCFCEIFMLGCVGFVCSFFSWCLLVWCIVLLIGILWRWMFFINFFFIFLYLCVFFYCLYLIYSD